MNAGACRHCGASVGASDRFCEDCGQSVADVDRIAVPTATPPAGGPCADCGGDAFVDRYCTVCGHYLAAPDRESAELGGIVLVTDRGRHHPRNEDAAAAGTGSRAGPAPGTAVAVAVCDGVSMSSEASRAAVAASAAGVDAMLAALAARRSPRGAVLAGLGEAARAAAATAVDDPVEGPSCTYTAAVAVPAGPNTVQIGVGNVGDSRAYWLPASPEAAEQLTVDDSVAQELTTAGAREQSEAVQAGAHVLTRWLGADAEAQPWTDSNVITMTATERGLLLLCTDGLWNYLPGADDIAQMCSGLDPATAARSLTDLALDAGGHDNITVAIVPIGDRS